MPNISTIGLFIGLLFAGIYSVFRWRSSRTEPDFMNIVTIIISCTGTIFGIYVFFLAIKASIFEQEKFNDFIISSAIGATAIIWISVKQIIKLFKKK